MKNMDQLYIEELTREFAILRNEKRFITSEVRKVSAKVFKKLPKI